MNAPDFSRWLDLEPYGIEASKKLALLTGASARTDAVACRQV